MVCIGCYGINIWISGVRNVKKEEIEINQSPLLNVLINKLDEHL